MLQRTGRLQSRQTNCILTWVGEMSRFSSEPPRPRTTIKAVHQNSTLCSGQLAGERSHDEGRSLVTKLQAGGAKPEPDREPRPAPAPVAESTLLTHPLPLPGRQWQSLSGSLPPLHFAHFLINGARSLGVRRMLISLTDSRCWQSLQRPFLFFCFPPSSPAPPPRFHSES